MTVFVDASAIVAMMTRESDDAALVQALAEHNDRLYSPVAFWEATIAVARKRQLDPDDVADGVQHFGDEFGLREVALGMPEARAAIAAWQRYGKESGSPAQLNMGDCFAYACARTNNARLLYKGDDFAHTDMA